MIARPHGMPKPRTGRVAQPIVYGAASRIVNYRTSFLPNGWPVAGHYTRAGGRFPATTPPQLLAGLREVGDPGLGFSLKGVVRGIGKAVKGVGKGVGKGASFVAKNVGKVAPLVALVPGVGTGAAIAIGGGGKFISGVARRKKIGDIAKDVAVGAAEGAAVSGAKKGAAALFKKIKGGTPLPAKAAAHAREQAAKAAAHAQEQAAKAAAHAQEQAAKAAEWKAAAAAKKDALTKRKAAKAEQDARAAAIQAQRDQEQAEQAAQAEQDAQDQADQDAQAEQDAQDQADQDAQAEQDAQDQAEQDALLSSFPTKQDALTQRKAARMFGGISPTTLMLGAAGLGAMFLLRGKGSVRRNPRRRRAV